MPLGYSDIAKLGIAAVATVVLTLLWIFLSRQDKVERTASYGCKVACRLLLIRIIASYLFCALLGLSVNTYLIIAAIVYIYSAAASWDSDMGASDGVGAAIAAPIIVILCLLKQFVLGFSDLDAMIPRPAKTEVSRDPPPRMCDTGIVVSSLRPMGTIDLAGKQFDARSASGTLIQAGTSIRVCGSQGPIYLVTEAANEAFETAE